MLLRFAFGKNLFQLLHSFYIHIINILRNYAHFQELTISFIDKETIKVKMANISGN